MITEIFQYLLENTSGHARKFGHLKESIAIYKRQKRNQKAWSSHQENCQNEIIGFCQNLKNRETILILGSGLLHEIPITYLQANFKKVVLVDIVHLNFVKKLVAKFPNVELIEHDLTEIEHHLIQGKMINQIPCRFLNENFSAVISANLMSQIPHNLKKYIEKNKIENDELIIDQFCATAYRQHYEYLMKFNSPSLIITDIETNLLNRDGQIIETERPTAVSILPQAKHQWIWNIAPQGEIDRELSLQMKVASIILDKN